MRDLGMLPLTAVDTSNISVGYGINGAGDVVGYSTRSNNTARSAFIWQSNTGLVNLNTLIDPALGWDLLEAHAISEDGTYITGIGKFEGQVHAFLLKNEVVDTTPPAVSFVITPALTNLNLQFQPKMVASMKRQSPIQRELHSPVQQQVLAEPLGQYPHLISK
jgi:probable HAF family extracellular repeat protein